MKLHLFLIIVGFISLASCKRELTDIPFVGVDSSGSVLLAHMPKNKFQKYNSRAIEYINHEALDALSSFEESQNINWKLDAIEVGLSGKVGVGIGEALKAEAELPFILVFKKRQL